MKKYLLTILFAILVIMPMGVNASLEFDMPTSTGSECEEGSNTCRAKVPVYASSTTGSAYIVEIGSPIVASITDIGGAVTGIEVISSDKFEFTYDSATQKVTITPKQPTVEVNEKEIIGYIVSVFDKTKGTGPDCGFSVDIEGTVVVPEIETEEPTNPETGVDLPIIILGVAAVAGIGVYFMTRKNTKMYKI